MLLTETITDDLTENVTEKVSLLQSHLPELQVMGIRILTALAVLLIGHRLILTALKIFRKAVFKANIDETAAHFFSSVLNALLHIFLVFIIAAQLGINTGTIVAILGSATIAIGLALQDSLKHFAGGLLILFMRPFKVGDYIICSAGEGFIRKIGIVYTNIVTLDNRQISVPNGTLASDNVTNCSAFPTRRVDTLVSVSYNEDIKAAKQILSEVYRNNPLILKDQEITVYVSELGESTIVLGALGYVSGSDYLKAKWSITEGIKLAFDEAGITIPYNQLDLHLKQ